MRIILISLCFLLLTACAQNKVTSSWVDKGYKNIPIKSVLVVAMSDNLRDRRIFEDTMAQQLELHGVMAMPSWQVFPSQRPPKKNIIDYAKKHNIQTIFMSRLINIENKTVSYPNNNFGYLGPNFGWNSYPYDYMNNDSYDVSYQYVNIGFTLFNVANYLPVWSTSIQSVDPSNINTMFSDISKILIMDMQKNNIINPDYP